MNSAKFMKEIKSSILVTKFHTHTHTHTKKYVYIYVIEKFVPFDARVSRVPWIQRHPIVCRTFHGRKLLRWGNPFTREIICPRKRHGTGRGRSIKIRMERSIGKHLSSTRTTRCWPEVEASKGSFVVGPFAEQLLFHRSVQRLSDTARYILFDARKSRGFSRLFESLREEGKHLDS